MEGFRTKDKKKYLFIMIALILALIIVMFSKKLINKNKDIANAQKEESTENIQLKLNKKVKISKEEIESLYKDDKNMFQFFNDFSGKKAPDFEMKDLDGKKVKLSDFKGKNVIIEFMGSWCSVCKKASPNNDKFNKKYKKAEILSIGIDDTAEDLKKLKNELGLKNSKFYLPIDEKTPDNYDVFFVPIYFYVDKEGLVQMILAGDASYDMLVEYADKSFK